MRSDDLVKPNSPFAGGETVDAVAVAKELVAAEEEHMVERAAADLLNLLISQADLKLAAVADLVPQGLVAAHALASVFPKHGRHGFSTPDR